MVRLKKDGKRTKQEHIALAAAKKAAKQSTIDNANVKVQRKGTRNRTRSKHPRVQRLLKKRGSLLVENAKKILLLKGRKSSQRVVNFLRDLNRLKSPNSKLFSKKNNIVPFDDDTSLKFLCDKNDCSMFGFASHNKKRPHNFILGRMFNWEVLDMVEVGIDQYLGLDEINGAGKMQGNKPMMLFQGDEFEHVEEFKILKSLLIDLFRGQETDSLNCVGLDSVMVCSSHKQACHMRWYFVTLDDSETKTPTVKLKNMGPFLDMTVRRCRAGPKELRKQAMRRPPQLKKKKVKNVTTNEMGEKVGRVYKKRQSIEDLQTRKVKALKRRKVEPAGANGKSK